WIAGKRAVSESRQLAAVLSRQVLASDPNLFLDEVEVVEQPVGRGGDPSALSDGLGDELIGTKEGRFVFGQTRQQPVGTRSLVDFVRPGQRPRVLLQLVDAQQFGAKR